LKRTVRPLRTIAVLAILPPDDDGDFPILACNLPHRSTVASAEPAAGRRTAELRVGKTISAPA
jgi:hypothetical protein